MSEETYSGIGSAALQLIGLTSLMTRGSGQKSIAIGIIDGPLDLNHPSFAGANLRTVRTDQNTSWKPASPQQSIRSASPRSRANA